MEAGYQDGSVEVALTADSVLAAAACGRYLQFGCKRVLDVAVACILLLALLPLLLVIAFLVWSSSPGPILFSQERVGRNAQRFRMYKFRTMVANGHPDVHRAYYELLVRGVAEPIGGKFKLGNDPRVTALGRILRHYSLDELPQLWNVLRGEMSLVGPRPPIPYEVELYGPREMGRLAVTPGLTGLWQVSGRSLLDFERMIALDLAYIERWSLWLDILILIRTPLVVLSARGAD
jgi:lipopolysaccharide/colanic/teichoic acid biosynthesis glycosyltransferase